MRDIESKMTSTEGGVDAANGDFGVTDCVVGDGSHVRCELLCFLQNKSKIVAFDDLIKVCEDFYTLAEVDLARSILIKLVPGKRISKPTGNDGEKTKKMLVSLLKTVLDSNLQLPSFYAVDLTRLPPISIEHIDASALLTELSALRAEVRTMRNVQQEVDKLRQSVDDLANARSFPSTSMQSTVEPYMMKNDTIQYPSLIPSAYQGNVNSVATSFATLAQDLQRAGMIEHNTRKAAAVKSKSASKAVTGSSTTNSTVKSVETARTVDVFVSRLAPMTTSSELVDCVNTIKGDLNVTDVKCVKLQSKFEHLYCSYHVAVTVNSVQFRSAIDLFTSAEAWPVGVFVKRYFKPRHGSSES